jgi:cytoskeletal protein CcmA (bactofilin family)
MKFKTKVLFIFLLCLLFLMPVFVLAQDAKENVAVAEDEIIDGNFIRFGNTVDIKGSVRGDVMVATNSLTISGPVAGDVVALANSVKITGSVLGSVRILANTVEIENEIGHNLWVAGNTLKLSDKSKVGWDVYATAANLEIKGPIAGRVFGSGDSIVIGSEIAKDVNLTVPAGQITLEPNANLKGNLTYEAAKDNQLILKEGAKVAGQTEKKSLSSSPMAGWENNFNKVFIFLKIVSFFSLLVVGLVLLTFLPKPILEIEAEMLKRPWPSFGWGFVFLVSVPFIVLLLLITLIGWPLALIILAFYLILIYLAKLIAGFTLGLTVVNYLNPEKKYKGNLFWPLLVGSIIFLILSLLPVFGGLVKFLLILWGLGATVTVIKSYIREYR